MRMADGEVWCWLDGTELPIACDGAELGGAAGFLLGTMLGEIQGSAEFSLEGP